MSDNKMMVIVACSIVLMITSIVASYHIRSVAMADRGYEQVSVIGHTGPVWQKIK